MSPHEIVGACLLLIGSALILLGAIGLHRFDDVFARMHAATKPATLGIVLTMTGAAIAVAEVRISATLMLIAALQFVTAPVGAHMVGRAAYRTGKLMSPGTSVDELAEALAEDRRARGERTPGDGRGDDAGGG